MNDNPEKSFSSLCLALWALKPLPKQYSSIDLHSSYYQPVLKPQFLRFLFVGLLNTAVGYGLFSLLMYLNLSYPLAIGLATLGGIAFNFQSTGRLVFNGAPWSCAGRFVVVYVVIYLLNVAAVALLLNSGLNVYLSNALAILPFALMTYYLQQKFVFKAS